MPYRLLASSAALALAASPPANADTTAVYRARDRGVETTVEQTDSGNVRSSLNDRGAYLLSVGDATYWIAQHQGKTVVQRLDDVSAVMREQERDAEALPKPTGVLEERGVLTINGWAGKAYFLVGGGGPASPIPVAVISDDPSLAPVGRAMARRFDMLRQINPMLRQSAFGDKLRELLNRGTALSLLGDVLVSVSNDPIDPFRFRIPAKPDSLSQIRSRFTER